MDSFSHAQLLLPGASQLDSLDSTPGWSVTPKRSRVSFSFFWMMMMMTKDCSLKLQ